MLRGEDGVGRGLSKTTAERTVTIAIVGKYTQLHDAYLSVAEALRHGGCENGVKVSLKSIESERLETEDPESQTNVRSTGEKLSDFTDNFPGKGARPFGKEVPRFENKDRPI